MKIKTVLSCLLAASSLFSAASAAPKTLFARRVEPLPAGATVERVYFMPDHFKSKRVFLKVKAQSPEGHTIYWHNLLPRSVFYDRTDYTIYYEADDLRLYTLGVSTAQGFGPPGFAFRLQPSVTITLESDRARLDFEDSEVTPGPEVPGQGDKIPFP